MVSVFIQVKLNTKRASQIIMALLVGSVFYGTSDASGGFFSKSAVLFFAIPLHASIAISEISNFYAQILIVERHSSYAFYHPAMKAIAGVVSDIPVNFCLAVAFNVILYFLARLKRELSQFFLFFLVTFVSMFVVSAVFRSMATLTKTISQAMALSGVLVLAIVVYTGFAVPVAYVHPWFGWIRWVNLVFYAFEILIADESHDRQFACSGFVPSCPTSISDQFVCSITGAVQRQRTVNGDVFIEASYGYAYLYVCRNLEVLFGFLADFMTMYFAAVELNSSTTSSAEILLFRRDHVPNYLYDLDKSQATDEGDGAREPGVNAQQGVDDAKQQKRNRSSAAERLLHLARCDVHCFCSRRDANDVRQCL